MVSEQDSDYRRFVTYEGLVTGGLISEMKFTPIHFVKTYIYDCPNHGDVLKVSVEDIDEVPLLKSKCSVMWCREPVKLRKGIFHALNMRNPGE